MDNDTDTERDVLCEKIINDMHSVFIKDNELLSFEIIPTILNCNKSPVLHVDHYLGLESWCMKHVYQHAHVNILKNWKKQIGQQQQLYESSTGGGAAGGILKYLNIALLINPDVQSFWNIRKQLMKKKQQNSSQQFNLNDELQFSALVLSKKAKSNDAFAYRRWLYNEYNEQNFHHSNNRILVSNCRLEFDLCENCSEKNSSNYHAWTHRYWILQNVINLCDDDTKRIILKTELEFTERFISKHISDYSCYHYRQILIKNIIYQLNYYELNILDKKFNENIDDTINLHDLQQLIVYYLVADTQTPKQLLNILLPDLHVNLIENDQLNSFLYCCNLAAHDIRLCDEQKNVYGERESFELHRRTLIKFIIEECVNLLNQSKQSKQIEQFKSKLMNLNDHNDNNDNEIKILIDKKLSKNHNFHIELENFNYEEHKLLSAIKKSEGLLGNKHRKWCSLFLGFNYN